ncbi:MAG: acyl carrier protein [Ruegeria sp.]
MPDTLPEAPAGVLKTYIESTFLGGQSVSDTDELLLSGMIDSLGVMSLVAFIEQTFGIEIPFEDVTLENFSSIAAMTEYAGSKRATSG